MGRYGSRARVAHAIRAQRYSQGKCLECGHEGVHAETCPIGAAQAARVRRAKKDTTAAPLGDFVYDVDRRAPDA
jgi:hypothetical protein